MKIKELVNINVSLFGYNDICDLLTNIGFYNVKIDNYVDLIENGNISVQEKNGNWFTIWFEPATQKDEQTMLDYTETWYEGSYLDLDILRRINIRITKVEEN